MEGNQQKMRDALLAIKEVADRDMRHHVSMSESDQTSIRAWANLFVSLVDSALAEPPRNCDVGTPYEQANRMRQFCEKQKRNGIINCGYCPIKHQYQRDCTLSWAQMPYEAEEGGAQ